MALVAALAVGACSGADDTAEEQATGSGQDSVAQGLEICVIHNNADHPSIAAIVDGMDDEAQVFGAEITYFDPANDPAAQATMVDDCIARDPDVMVVNAVEPAAIVPALQRASEAGVTTMMQNANTNEEGQQYIETFVGTEAYNQGYAVGEMMSETLGGEGNVVAILGNVGQIDVTERMRGMQAAWEANDANFELIAEQPAEWQVDQAQTVMQDMLTRFDDIDAVFALDDPMALGALNAIEASGREGDIAVFGVNGNVEACEAIQEGRMEGTALQHSYLIGVYTVRTAYDLVQGRVVPPEVLAPTAPVTQDNIDQWMESCW